jgi:uncharacterized membrane-anchored protein
MLQVVTDVEKKWISLEEISTFMMQTSVPPETFVAVYQITWRHKQADSNRRPNNLKVVFILLIAIWFLVLTGWCSVNTADM